MTLDRKGLISIWIAWNKLPYWQIPGSNFAFADMLYIIDIYRYKHKLKMNIYLQSLHKKAKPLQTVSPKDSSDGNNLLYTGCPKINETHKIANKYVDFNPIVYIFQI